MGSQAINLDTTNGCNERVPRECNLSQSQNGHLKQFLKFLCTKICVCLIIFGIISIVLVCVVLLVNYENDSGVMLTVDVLKEDLSPEQDVWFRKGLKELETALNNPINIKRARNVVLFVADGFHPMTIHAARVRGYKKEAFAWDHFPHLGILRWHRDNSVGTALFGGVGARSGTSGVDSATDSNYCTIALDDARHVKSVLSWAQESALGTGFVTNGDIRDGTAAALYAHVANDSWKCPEALPEKHDEILPCLDVQTQLLGHYPGKEFNIVVGWNVSDDFCDSASFKSFCKNKHCFIDHDVLEFWKVTPNTKHIRAIFPDSLRNHVSIHDLVTKSIQILNEAHDRFVLVVIFKPMSQNIEEDILELDETVKSTIIDLGDSLDETLIIVASSPFSDKRTYSLEEESMDTVVYAKGPMAHLFHTVHDSTYVAHMIAYAARLGWFRDSVLASSIMQWFS